MYKLSYEILESLKGKDTGFFCKINNFLIKYAFFTNNHVLNELIIEIGRAINFK